MIITQKSKEQVVQSHDFEQVNCTIDAEDMRYVASLLRNNYSNTRLAVVREISANALDANKEAGVTRQIEIKLPTTMNPTFAVRDFGGGLSQEDVFGLYSKYGKSTKRTSNNYIGAFGIGKFAPLSYGDNFTCVSYHGGLKTSYNVFVNDDDDTKIAKLHEEPTSEPTGLSIEVAVSEGDIEEFRSVVKTFFQFFPEDEMPKFIGVEEDFLPKNKFSLESATDDWFILENDSDDRYHYSSACHVIMGRVSYRLDRSSVNVNNFIKDDKAKKIVEELLTESKFFLRVPIGSVKLHHSRESLEYNQSTQKALCKALYNASQEILDIAKLKLADSKDLWEAKRNHAVIVNSLNYSIRNIFNNAFEWNGIKIKNAHFSVPYDESENITITRSIRTKDNDARNGYKVVSSKQNKAFCQDNYLFVYQDLDSSHGNNLRSRTLFNEDEDLQEIFFINPANQDGIDYMNNEWSFNLIDSKHIRKASEVEKEKPVYNRVSGESRASIPLFKMVKNKGYVYRNADYWSNVNDPINSVEAGDMEGSVDGKLIYVPISRYQIDCPKNELWDLDKVYTLSSQVRAVGKSVDNEELANLVVFGVRKADIKKLDKSNWVSFTDFMLDHYKEYVRENKRDCSIAFRRVLTSESGADYQKIMDFLNPIENVFTNKNVKLDFLAEDHILNRIVDICSVINTADHKQKASSSVFYITLHDRQWLLDTLRVDVDSESTLKTIEKATEKYPLLSFIADSISYYGCLDNHHRHGDIQSKLEDYINLCDKGDGE